MGVRFNIVERCEYKRVGARFNIIESRVECRSVSTKAGGGGGGGWD